MGKPGFLTNCKADANLSSPIEASGGLHGGCLEPTGTMLDIVKAELAPLHSSIGVLLGSDC